MGPDYFGLILLGPCFCKEMCLNYFKIISQVALNGLDAFAHLAERMGSDFKPYMTIVLPPVIDRLGKQIYLINIYLA